MRLLPYDRFAIAVAASREELRKRLAAHVGKGDAPFRGKLVDDGFTIWRAISYRNSFNPVIIGRIADGRVEVQARLHAFVLAFMAVWMSGALAGLAAFAVALGAGQRFEPMMLVPLGLPVFGYALAQGCFWMEARTLRAALCELFGGHISP